MTPRDYSNTVITNNRLAHLLGASPGAAQQRVGIDSAVNPQASGTPPGAASRGLAIGQEVLFNERLATASAGQVQVLFLDESALSIGPNSDVVVDQFVYDPQAGAGRLALSATKGAFRYVGGKLSKQENAVTLGTPSATLAIRCAPTARNTSGGRYHPESCR